MFAVLVGSDGGGGGGGCAGDGARATALTVKVTRHKECRTRGEALDFYGNPKNQKDGLSSKQLKLIAGALDQSALQLLGYDCPDAVQRTEASFKADTTCNWQARRKKFQALSEMASRLLPLRGLATDAEPGDFSDVMKFCAGGSHSPTAGSRPRPNLNASAVSELDALKDLLQRFLAQEQAHLVRRIAELEEGMFEVMRGTVEPAVHVANLPLLPCGAAAAAAEAELSVSIPLERPVFLAPDAVRFEVGHISEASGLKHHQHVTISPAHSVAMSQPTSPGSTRHGVAVGGAALFCSLLGSQRKRLQTFHMRPT
eukprot:s960_g6.t1